MSELATCKVCGLHDVSTISITSTSGLEVRIWLCPIHEKLWSYGVGIVLSNMVANHAAAGVRSIADEVRQRSKR